MVRHPLRLFDTGAGVWTGNFQRRSAISDMRKQKRHPNAKGRLPDSQSVNRCSENRTTGGRSRSWNGVRSHCHQDRKPERYFRNPRSRTWLLPQMWPAGLPRRGLLSVRNQQTNVGNRACPRRPARSSIFAMAPVAATAVAVHRKGPHVREDFLPTCFICVNEAAQDLLVEGFSQPSISRT